MTMTLLSRRTLLAALAAVSSSPSMAQAGFPSRAIRVVVPWPPGGLVDTGGRVVAEALNKAFGQGAAVENIAGAAGTLGADQVAKAAPDGHTLLMATSSIAIDVAGQRRMAFDPVRDLAPVALVADTFSVVVVPVASPVKTLSELLAAAKARPGELNYGTPGVGSPAHLFSELLAQSAGLQLTHVPYGRSPAMNDLLAGRLQLMVATGPASLPQIRAGQLRALAVTGRERFAELPDVPTVAEAGVPGYEAGQWLGVFAPAATPRETVQRLSAEIGKALTLPAVVQLLQQRGMERRAGGPDELARALSGDIRKWTQVMRSAQIKLES
jgi:tripartite-type tricarboxylate transporter receptor subunit TctC